MSILTQLKQNFDNFLKNNFSVSDNYCLMLISKLLEECDLELAATRDKSLEIVKKVSRTILTSKGPITFKRRYYYKNITKILQKVRKNYICITFATLVDMKIPIWYSYYSKNKGQQKMLY